jgi:hypothetical protein
VPERFALMNKPDSIITFSVSSGGFELIVLKYLAARKPIVIDLDSLTIDNQNGRFSAVYSTEQISDDISEMFSFSENLISFSPKQIYFRFEALSEKKVKVISRLNIEFEKQHMQSDSLVITPDKVTVIGTRKAIDQVNFVEAFTNSKIRLDKPMKITADLRSESKMVKIHPSKVEIFIPVEKYTESTLQIPIYAEAGNNKIRMFPEFATITYLVAMKNYNRVNKEMFRIVAVTDNNFESQNRLSIIVKNQPSFVKIIKIEPPDVEFLILKND